MKEKLGFCEVAEVCASKLKLASQDILEAIGNCKLKLHRREKSRYDLAYSRTCKASSRHATDYSKEENDEKLLGIY